MAEAETTAETQPAQATPTYTVVVRIAFIADGQPIASTEAQGQLGIPAEGDTQLINVPIDARAFAEGFIPALTALAMRDAAKEARENVGALETVERGPIVLPNGQPATRQKPPNRATRRGHLTRVRD